MLTCGTLRGAILTSAIFLLAAWAVSGLASIGFLNPVAASYMGFILIVCSAFVFIVTFVLSLLPSSARRLSECEH